MITSQVGSYHASSLLVASRPPTPGVLSRGIGLEGLSGILAGLWGTGTGSTTLTENVHTIAVTKMGSRRAVELGACFLIVLSLVGTSFFFEVAINNFAWLSNNGIFFHGGMWLVNTCCMFLCRSWNIWLIKTGSFMWWVGRNESNDAFKHMISHNLKEVRVKFAKTKKKSWLKKLCFLFFFSNRLIFLFNCEVNWPIHQTKFPIEPHGFQKPFFSIQVGCKQHLMPREGYTL